MQMDDEQRNGLCKRSLEKKKRATPTGDFKVCSTKPTSVPSFFSGWLNVSTSTLTLFAQQRFSDHVCKMIRRPWKAYITENNIITMPKASNPICRHLIYLVQMQVGKEQSLLPTGLLKCSVELLKSNIHTYNIYIYIYTSVWCRYFW